MAHRVFNFNPGPSTLPLEVLKKVQEELLDYKGTGMSVMEISHRSAEYEEIKFPQRQSVRHLAPQSCQKTFLSVHGLNSLTIVGTPRK